MAIFDDILDAAAPVDIAVLGGQSVSFTPNGGAARTITVLIDYINDDEHVIEGSWKKDPVIQVTALNSSTRGIDLASWSTNDAISLPPRKGATAITFRLSRVVDQNTGFAVYRVT